jgi:sugar phosphate isomerase/epimerase
MVFGICTSLVQPENDTIDTDMFPLIKKLGYSYIELPLINLMKIPDREWPGFCGKVEHSVIPVDACHKFFSQSQRITGPSVDFRGLSKYTDKALQRASEIGAQVVVFGSPFARNIPEGFPREEGWNQIIRATDMIGEAAERHRIFVGIEYHNREEANILNSMREAVELYQAVNRPSIRILSDYYHMAYEQEPVSELRRAKGLIIHAHFAEVEERSFPKEPKPEYRAYFASLRKAGYFGRVSIEAFTKDFERDAVRALEVLKECTEE